MARRDSRLRAGFTLIEVLATFVLIAIVLPAVAKGVSICVRAERTAKTQVEVATLAQSKLAELVAYPGWESQALSGDFAPEHPDFQWMAASLLRDDGLTEVMLVVNWTDVDGPRSWNASALVYRGTQ